MSRSKFHTNPFGANRQLLEAKYTHCPRFNPTTIFLRRKNKDKGKTTYSQKIKIQKIKTMKLNH
jgi:hypothetical protein